MRKPQRVVCIKDDWTIRHSGVTYPVKGVVYTIRNRLTYVNGDGYMFEEIVNEPHPCLEGLVEISFHVANFRPVTDISDLVKLTKVRELEDA